MELSLSQLQPLSFVIGPMVVATVLFSRQLPKGGKKSQENRVLLRQLLENFDLEIPDELNESDENIVRPIKTN